MRNLKKVLALVLALVMSLSLVTIANAADFTDADDIQYTEAVEVMTTLGVFEGFEDDSFQPDATLTREQAAKIITYMLLGDNADKLGYSSSSFSDVPATRWSAPYINYCASTGIIVGNGDGTYSPTKPLTGYAFAKMLLGALGYDAEIEGFVGAGWNLKVAAMAAKTGLLNDIKSFAGNDGISRDQACQLALNTLKATMVVYDGTTIDVTTGESTVTIGNTNYSYGTSNHADINKNIEGTTQGNNAQYFTLEFGEQHYPDLVLNRGVQDDFGRPSNEWVFKKVAIGVYPVASDFEYTTQMSRTTDTSDTKVKNLGLRSYKLYNERTDVADNVDLYVNGRRYNSAITSVGQIADLTDNGTLVQLYTSDSRANTIIAVVVVKSQMMQVKNVGSDYVSLEEVDEHVDIVGTANNAFNSAYLDVNVANVKEGDDGYEVLSGLKEEDLVVVIPVTIDGGATYSVVDVYVPETVVGKLTSVGTYNSDNVNVTVGGTKYDISLWNDDFAQLTANSIAATTKDVTLYLDAYGNAMKIKDAGATSSYMVVSGTYRSLVDGKIVNMMKGWDLNGTAVELNLGTTGNGFAANIVGNLVKYTNSGATNGGEYVISNTGNGGAEIYLVDNANAILASDAKIELDTDGNLGTDDGALYWVAKDIKFVYATINSDNEIESIEIKNGVQKTEVAEITADYTALGVTGSVSAQAYLDKNDAVKAVVIKQESNDAISSDLMYIQAFKGEQGVDESGKKVYGYTVSMMTDNGVEDGITIYSYKNVATHSFAKYAEVSNDQFENFYTLSAYDMQERTTSTVKTTIDYVVNVNQGLADVGTIYEMDGTTAATTNLDSSQGAGDVADIVRLLDAEWVDLTNFDINSVKDLAEVANSGLYTIQVSLIVNDNVSSNGFRNVSLIVIESVTRIAPTNVTLNSTKVAFSTSVAGPWTASLTVANGTTVYVKPVSSYATGVTISGNALAASGTAGVWQMRATANVVDGNVTVATSLPTLDTLSSAAEVNEVLAAAGSGDTVTLNGDFAPSARIEIPDGVTFQVTGNFTDANGVRTTGNGKLKVDGQYENTIGIINNVEAGSVKLDKDTTVSGALKVTGSITSTTDALTVASTGSVEAASTDDDLIVNGGTATISGNVGGALTLTGTAKATVASVTGTITDAATSATERTELTITGNTGSVGFASNTINGKVSYTDDTGSVTLTAATTTIGQYADVTVAGDWTGAANKAVALNGKLTVNGDITTDATSGSITLGATAVLTVNGTLDEAQRVVSTNAGATVVFGDAATITAVSGANFKKAGGSDNITTTAADYQGKTFVYVADTTNAFVAQ